MKRILATVVLSGFLLTAVPVPVSGAPLVPIVMIIEADDWQPRTRWRRRNRYRGR